MNRWKALLKRIKTPWGIIIIFVIILIIAIISIVLMSDSHKEQLHENDATDETENTSLDQFEEGVYEAINELHDIYISEYKSAVRVIKDYSYSDEFRRRYIIKLDELIGYSKYMSIYSKNGSFYDVIVEIQSNEYNDRQWLYSKAGYEVCQLLKGMLNR